MNLTPEMLLEACYPLGDARHQREVKRRAVQGVVLDRISYRAAARLVGGGVTVDAVIRWVDEFEERLKHAKDCSERQRAGEVV